MLNCINFTFHSLTLILSCFLQTFYSFLPNFNNPSFFSFHLSGYLILTWRGKQKTVTTVFFTSIALATSSRFLPFFFWVFAFICPFFFYFCFLFLVNLLPSSFCSSIPPLTFSLNFPLFLSYFFSFPQFLPRLFVLRSVFLGMIWNFANACLQLLQ